MNLSYEPIDVARIQYIPNKVIPLLMVTQYFFRKSLNQENEVNDNGYLTYRNFETESGLDLCA